MKYINSKWDNAYCQLSADFKKVMMIKKDSKWKLILNSMGLRKADQPYLKQLVDSIGLADTEQMKLFQKFTFGKNKTKKEIE